MEMETLSCRKIAKCIHWSLESGLTGSWICVADRTDSPLIRLWVSSPMTPTAQAKESEW